MGGCPASKNNKGLPSAKRYTHLGYHASTASYSLILLVRNMVIVIPSKLNGRMGTFRETFRDFRGAGYVSIKSLKDCFRGPSSGKLFLEIEEGCFRDRLRVHDLLVNAPCSSKTYPNEIKPLYAAGPFRDISQGVPSANLPWLQSGATLLVHMPPLENVT